MVPLTMSRKVVTPQGMLVMADTGRSCCVSIFRPLWDQVSGEDAIIALFSWGRFMALAGKLLVQIECNDDILSQHLVPKRRGIR